MTGLVVSLPRARSEDGMLREIEAIVRAGRLGLISKGRAERDADAVLRCWATIQGREQATKDVRHAG